MQKSVVIVTHSGDNSSVEKVALRIRENGFNTVRFNTDQYPTDFTLSAELKNGQYSHQLTTLGGETLQAEDIHSIWYRRFSVGKNIDPAMEKQMRSACVEESKRSVLGLLTCSDQFQMDPYWTVKKASNKDYQLKLATEIGLDLPATLVTNDEKQARRFYDTHSGNIITKMQTAFAIWENGVEQVVFTNEVREEHLQNLDGLRQCPMVFQEKIEKALELRVTIVGQQVFCAAIDSNAHKHMQTDWRKRGQDTLEDWFQYTLPTEVQQKVLQLTHRLQLNYGAIDIILTPENRYKFLEINPCGEFYWMDHFTKLNICDAIADLLTAHTNASAH